MINNEKIKMSCWVCGHDDWRLFKVNNLGSALQPDSFAITDSHYGVTTELYQCQNCAFVQSSETDNVLSYYEQLEDQGYESSREARALQADKILEQISKIKTSGKLFDVGAGSGILLESAAKFGYRASGVEPSHWLSEQAKARGLAVREGIFVPSKEEFDIITLIDVIEHVDNPHQLVLDIYNSLRPGGILVLATPDFSSLFAKVMKHRWWHYRIAHIGYFNRQNLNYLLTKVGYRPLVITTAKWYFSLDYLWERCLKYLPTWLQVKAPQFSKHITIPLDLRDSILAIYQK